MATTPRNTVAASVEPSNLDKVLAAMATKPARQASALHRMVAAVAERQGINLDTLTAGKKAALTRSVKEACKASGISL